MWYVAVTFMIKNSLAKPNKTILFCFNPKAVIMHCSGILILTHHVSLLCRGSVVKEIIAGVKKIVSSTLYVHVANTLPVNSVSGIQENHQEGLSKLLKTENVFFSYQDTERHFSKDVIPFLSKFYAEASLQCRELDVNILLHSVGYQHNVPCHLKKRVHCIIADCNLKVLENKDVNSSFHKFVNSLYCMGNTTMELPLLSVSDAVSTSLEDTEVLNTENVTSKGSVVVGGTFDHIHSGHKVLLSESILLAHKRLLIGLTDGEMLEKKTLFDLIKPWKTRQQELTNFVCDIAHFQEKVEGKENQLYDSNKAIVEVARIADPVGPSATDPDLQCIVVSKETEKGGEYVNKVRTNNGLNRLHVHLMAEGGLVDDKQGSIAPTNEKKFSSSTIRYNSLGTLRRPPNKSDSFLSQNVYVIGLTGGIASGKSSVAKHIENHGAVVIDCDKLGHVAYEPGTDAFVKVVERFGREVVSPSGTIDRKVLASKVFTGDSQEKNSNLTDLNAIVWPEIERLARGRITEAVENKLPHQEGKIVCVLDAAVLLEAGWDRFVNEVWVCNIPKEEAIRRIQERDGRSREEAEKRIQAQMSGGERAEKSHVVLSTLWEVDVTKAQVQKAWKLLQERLGSNQLTSFY